MMQELSVQAMLERSFHSPDGSLVVVIMVVSHL
jgi:hypothetical protein